MRRFVTALLVYLPQDDAYVLRALGDPDCHGISRLKEICGSNFSHQVRPGARLGLQFAYVHPMH